MNELSGSRKNRKKKRRLGNRKSRVMAATDGWCVMKCGRPVEEIHHLLYKGAFPQYATVEQNLIGVCHICHVAHHKNQRRIHLFKLPWDRVEFVLTHGKEFVLERYHIKMSYPRKR